jgi:WD40 repeat protein
MPRTTTPVAILALALLCCAPSVGQPPGNVPVAESVRLPQALTSAKLRFSPAGDKLLVVRQYGDGRTPLLTIHDTRPGPKQGQSTASPPLVYPDLVANNTHPDNVYLYGVTAAWGPDGNVLVTSSFRLVRLWNIRSSGRGYPPRPVMLNLPDSTLAAFTGGGKHILTASVVGEWRIGAKLQFEVRLWDVGSGKPIGEPSTTAVLYRGAHGPRCGASPLPRTGGLPDGGRGHWCGGHVRATLGC